MPVTTVAIDRKTGLSHMIVIICMKMYDFALFIIVCSLKNVNSFFYFIETITGRYINHWIAKQDSLFTESPPFLLDIIFISRKHSLLSSIYFTGQSQMLISGRMYAWDCPCTRVCTWTPKSEEWIKVKKKLAQHSCRWVYTLNVWKVRHTSRIESWLGCMLGALPVVLCTKKLLSVRLNWRMKN